MFFYISKILRFLLDPFTWVLIGILIGLVKQKKWLSWTAFILLIFLSNPFLANLTMSGWEAKPQLKKDLPKCDVGIVLSGMTRLGQYPKDQVHFADGVDRITEALRLYNKGTINKILLTGGSSSIIYDNAESNDLMIFLIESGVKSSDLIVETESMNTHQNAVNAVRMIKELGLVDSKILLITSAFHMKRSLLCFEKQGLEVLSYPVDYRTSSEKFGLSMLVPSSDSIKIWRALIEEITGAFTYKLMGYI